MNNDSKEDVLKLHKKRRRLALQIAAWVAGAAVVVLLLAGITVTILLHNQRFHDYVLRSAEKQASEGLGVRVTLQNFALNLSHLSLDLYGLTVDGAAPYTDTPLLQVDHAEAGVQVVSILHRKWYLDSFQIDRPIVRIFIDDKGVSNLPTFKSSGTSSSNTNLFDLAIRHALLSRGEVYYNNRQSALAADLHDVEFKAAFNSLLQQYSGRLAYSNGRIVSGSFKPLSHSLEAVFDATPTTFHLTEAKLSAGPSQILLNATVQNYSSPNVEARYDATIDGMQAGQILQSPSTPIGQVRATGSLHYQQSANRSLLESLMLSGDLSSRQLNVKSASVRTQITNLLAHYSLANGDVTLHDLKLNLLGGQLTGFGMMTNIVGDSHSKVNANLRGVSLADLKRLTGGSSPAARNVGLEGVLNAQLAATWGKTFNDLAAHADATINGRVMGSAAATTAVKSGDAGQAGISSISIDSAIHGTYTASNQQIAVKDSYVRMPQTSLTMNGVVSKQSSLAIRLQADDLREVEAVADLFRAAPQGQPLQPLGLVGTASFQGTVQGSTSAPHLTGQFLASNVHVNGSEWKVLRTNVDASPSLVSLQHGDLEPATRGHIAFNASTGLTKWSFSNTSPVQIEVEASQLNVADLVKLGGQSLPVSGTVAANFNIHGTELSPTGNGSISLERVVAYDQPVRSARLSFAGTGDEAHANLEVLLPAGNVQGKVTVQPRQRTFVGQVTATGIKLDELQALKARNVDAAGELSLHASGQGSFDNPQLDATLQIPQLVVQNQTIKALKLQMDVADRVANAMLTTSAVNTNIQAKAKVNLTGDYLADATLDTQAIPFAPLLAAYLPEQAANIDGQTEIHATLHGPLKNKNLIEAHVSVPMLQMAYGKTVQLAAASPIHLDYKNGVVAIQRATIHGTDTDLQVQGSIPIAGVAAGNTPMSLMLLGTVNLQLAQLFDPDVRTSGELKFNVNSTGVSGSGFGGQIDIVDAAFASSDLPIGMQHGNGVLTFTKDRLNITKFEGTVGGGSLTAQGGVALQPSIQFDVGVAAHGIRMLYPQGVRESLNANLRLAGTTDSAVLGGSVNLSDISFTSAFDLNSFISQFSGGVEAPPTPGFGQNLQLNLAVRSTNDVSLVSRSLSVNGSANLQVRGTASNPVILGRVNLNGGDIILNGDRYLLDGGTIAFVNPSETEPVVNLSLKTTIQQYDVFLRFNGPIDQLRTNYSSNPALPSADIINLLAFGETTEASANATTTTNQAAQSLVASQVSSQVTSRVSKIAGISQLSINPVLTSGNNEGPGANITIQQRVTSNLFVTFTSNVAATQSQTIQGQYQVSPRVAISATRDQNGGFAVDTLIKKTW
jgi:translocation and assembly module TamB